MNNRVKAALCARCHGWTIVSACPHGDTDNDTLAEFKREVIAGATIEYITVDDLHRGTVVHCSCRSGEQAQTEMFTAQPLKESV